MIHRLFDRGQHGLTQNDDDIRCGGVIMTITALFVILALAATVATLFWGVGSMAHGGAYDSEQIMFTRVGIQAVAVALIVLAIYFSLA